MSGAIFKAKLDGKGKMGLHMQHVRGQAASAKARGAWAWTAKKRPWTTLTVERRWAWHAITTLGQHTQSDDIGHGMPSAPLDITHGRTTLDVA